MSFRVFGAKHQTAYSAGHFEPSIKNGQTNGESGVTKLTVVFRSFANAPNNDLKRTKILRELFIKNSCLRIWVEGKCFLRLVVKKTGM